MQVYQLRGRLLKIESGPSRLEFPNDVELTANLLPSEIFGVGNNPTTTFVVGQRISAPFDGNTGRRTGRQPVGLQRVKVQDEDHAGRLFVYDGNRLSVRQHCETGKDLIDLCETLYHKFPLVATATLGEPIVITELTGKLGPSTFRWWLDAVEFEADIVTQELQQERAVASWRRLSLLQNRRLAAALQYYHVGMRLARVGNTPWEFMAEMLVNFAKVLDALFPATQGGTIDATRKGLKGLGYEETVIERDFIPIIALRNRIDSAHVSLARFSVDQLRTLHEYTSRIPNVFRVFIRDIISRIEVGSLSVGGTTDKAPDREVVQIIERIRAALSSKNSPDQDEGAS